MKKLLFAVVAMLLATSCLITEKTTTIFGQITAWYELEEGTEVMDEEDGLYYLTAAQFFNYKNLEAAEADIENAANMLLKQVYIGFTEAQIALDVYDIHQKWLKTYKYTFVYDEEKKEYEVTSEFEDANGTKAN